MRVVIGESEGWAVDHVPKSQPEPRRIRWTDLTQDLYLREWAPLVRLAAMLLDDTSAAEDVVQEAFVRFSLKGFDRDTLDSPIAYLRRIVVNLSRNTLRRRLVAARHAPRPDDPGGPADGSTLEAAEREEVLTHLRRLPRRQREAVVLRYYGELSMAEMAAAMGVALGTAKSTLSKGTAGLAEMMEVTR
jgi:RNA polymerase sigma factor (sigma-70 family)